VSERRYIAATAGHIDHGKSALVQRLTGTDPDRLAEEKRRGITIELGYADLELRGPASEESFRVGLVDVPGHEDFVKNMVAGVGQVDLAILVVAADDGWMPQTEEHVQILEYLGARSGVIALTKADLVVDSAPRAEQIAAAAQGSLFDAAAIVPVSALHGTGMEALRQAMAAALEPLAPRADDGKPRLAVDRAFSIAGAGTVVTGTLVGGMLQRGGNVVVQPTGTRSRIRSLQTFNAEVETAAPGTRVALNLAAVQPTRATQRRAPTGVRRGDVVGYDSLVAPTTVFDAALTRSSRLGRDAPAMQKALRVRLHVGTRHLAARIGPLSSALQPGSATLARVQTDAPLQVLVGDRFVLRDWAQQHTLAGGVVLDPLPTLGHADAQQQAFLSHVRSDNSAAALLLAYAARDGAANASRVGRVAAASVARVQEAADSLQAAGTLDGNRHALVLPVGLRALMQAVVQALAAYIQAHPERGAVPLQEVNTVLAGRAESEHLAGIVEERLIEIGYRLESGNLHPPGVAASVPPELTAILTQVRHTLAAEPLMPPPRRQLAETPEAAKVIEFLLASGEAVRIGLDVVMLKSAYTLAAERVVAFLTRNHEATASELRRAVDTNRRIIIPLLEHLDRAGITARFRDNRRLVATE
jgi:selenocysteine-specific elongation factor